MKKYAMLAGTILAWTVFAPAAHAGQTTAAAAPDGQSTPAQPAGSDQATSDAESPLGDIVVTAQRRSESQQRAAISVTARTGDQLLTQGVNSIQQLSSVAPALQITPATGTYTWFAVRGVSNTGANAFADPAVAVNLDGVYLATPTVLEGLLYDLDRVEILKGPQGTLYGRNATAGAINIITKQPDFDFGGDATLEVGNFASVFGQGALNVPVTDGIAIRFAGMGSKRDGYFSDGTSDSNLVAGRVSLLFKPSDNFRFVVIGDFADQRGRGTGSTVIKDCGGAQCYVGGVWTGLADQSAAFAPIAPKSHKTYLNNNYRGVSTQLQWDNPLGTLTMIGAHRWSDVDYYTHTTGILISEQQKPEATSFEARLASRGEGLIRWLVGTYYLDTTMRSRSVSENGAGRSFGDQRTYTGGTAWAGFGQLTIAPTETLRLVGGLRYTTEKKFSRTQRYNVLNTVGPDPIIPLTPTSAPIYSVDESHRWNSATWKLGVEWDVGTRSLLYANASTGFKAGGFFSGPPGNDSYAPEKVTAYVAGSKNRFLNNTLQVNAELFYLDYRDQQISYTKIVGAASVSVTENAGRLTAKGAEVEVNWFPLRNTQLGANVQYLDTEYNSLVYFTPSPPAAQSLCELTPGQPGGTTRVNCNGLDALQSPKWSMTGSIDQTVPLANGGKMIARANVLYETERYNHISYVPTTISPANARLDLSLTYEAPGGAWRVTAYGRNVTDTVTPTYILPPPGFNQNAAFVAVLKPPRTYGLRVQGKF